MTTAITASSYQATPTPVFSFPALRADGVCVGEPGGSTQGVRGWVWGLILLTSVPPLCPAFLCFSISSEI